MSGGINFNVKDFVGTKRKKKKCRKKVLKVGDMFHGMIITEISKKTLTGVHPEYGIRKIKWTGDGWVFVN